MTVDQLSSELYIARAAITNMHNWMTTVAEAVEDHADQLEATSADFTFQRNQLSAYERQMVEGLNTAEAKLTDKFTELGKSVSELRQQTHEATRQTKAADCFVHLQLQ